MVQSFLNGLVSSAPEVMRRIKTTGELSHEDYLHLTSLALANRHVDGKERRQIHSILERVRYRELKLMS
jgi:hypothetical protein